MYAQRAAGEYFNSADEVYKKAVHFQMKVTNIKPLLVTVI